ncbi:MAG TPA: response regulator transcription factor, partial [Anaerolineaceae bacterium]|nr:response regulator transcription factor [Anaerolineaceae bacterium]
ISLTPSRSLCGARGYLLKEEEPDAVVQAVRALAEGRTWISPLAVKALVEELPDGGDTPAVDLSEREHDVLRLLAEGLDNPRIAETLSIAEGTVKNHVTNIYEKLGVHSRAEAVALAWKRGII